MQVLNAKRGLAQLSSSPDGLVRQSVASFRQWVLTVAAPAYLYSFPPLRRLLVLRGFLDPEAAFLDPEAER